jgi:hypothetical protein
MTLSAHAWWKLEPVMPSRGPKLRRSSEAWVSKAADRHTKSSRQAFGAEQHTRSASRAEKAVDEASGVALLPVLPTLAGSAYSGLREYGSVGERASAAALAIGATAQIDLDRLAARRDSQICRKRNARSGRSCWLPMHCLHRSRRGRAVADQLVIDRIEQRLEGGIDDVR